MGMIPFGDTTKIGVVGTPGQNNPFFDSINLRATQDIEFGAAVFFSAGGSLSPQVDSDVAVLAPGIPEHMTSWNTFAGIALRDTTLEAGKYQDGEPVAVGRTGNFFVAIDPLQNAGLDIEVWDDVYLDFDGGFSSRNSKAGQDSIKIGKFRSSWVDSVTDTFNIVLINITPRAAST